MLLPARPSIPTPVAIGVFATASVVAIGLGIAGTGKAVVPGDVDISRLLQIRTGSAPDVLASVIHEFGSTTWAIRFLFLGTLLSVIARWWPVAFYFLTLAALRMAGGFLKPIFDSPRPTDELVQIAGTRDMDYGYPSGHALTAATLALGLSVLAWRYLPSRRLARLTVIVLVAGGLAVGWSRVQSGAHWATDVAGGFAFGIMNVAIATVVLNVLSGRNSPFRSARQRRR